MSNNSIPYGVSCLYLYNDVNERGLIKALYSLHTVSGQPYHSAYVSIEKVLQILSMPKWIVLPGTN